jgi:hypothetical protein
MKQQNIHEEKIPPFAEMSGSQMIQLVAVGLASGLLLWILYYVFATFVFKGFCAPDVGVCAEASTYALGTATVITAALTLFSFVKLRAFRPLLIVLAATASLWGILLHLGSLSPVSAAASLTLLHGIAYAVFGWLARIRLFWVSVLCIVLLVVGIRLILNS